MMRTLHNSSKLSSKSNSAPVPNLFQSRPFSPPNEVSPLQQENPYLQKQQQQSKASGFDFANVSITPRNSSNPPFLQRRGTIRQPEDRNEPGVEQEMPLVVDRMNSPGNPMVQRYESPEHQDLGDKALGELSEFLGTPEGKDWVKKYNVDAKAASALPNDPMLKGQKIKVGTLELTPGDIIALMGDFYRTPQDLAKAPPEEIKELLGVMKREREGTLAGGEANELYQKTTLKYRTKSDSYLELAKNNDPHFTPGNRAEWTKLHLQAIEIAKQAGSDEAAFQQALLIDAAGGHFLTDAFASGHLFDKKELEVEIISYLQKNPAQAQNPEMQPYYGIVNLKGAMPQLVLKNIHDRLNAEGVDVTNKKGMKWKTFGDDHLKNAEQTRHIAALAVYLSRQQVTLARKQGSSTPNPEEILDLLPDEQSVKAATANAIAYIPAAVQSISALMYRQRRIARTEFPSPFGRIIESNVATIANPGRQNQLEQLDATAKKTGIPQVVPSFTLFEW